MQLLLDTATHQDPKFKDSFIVLEDDVKESLLQKAGNVGAMCQEFTVKKKKS